MSFSLFEGIMNRVVIHIVLAGLVLCTGAFVSCSKERSVQKTRVSFIVKTESDMTKAALTETQESRVASLDLLVFRSADGMLDCHVRTEASGSGSVSMLDASVTSGIEVDWFIVANIPADRIASVDNKGSFLSKLTSISDMSAGTMVMYAFGSQVFDPGTNLIENVGLIRYACKVTVDNILVSWLGTFEHTPTCTLDEIALVNVRGTCPLSGVPTADAADLWYNKSSVGNYGGFLQACLDWTGSMAIAGPQSYDVGVSLFAMPNASEGEGMGPVTLVNPWTPRRTRIALKLTIDGASQWYPVDLPAMSGKTHYVVSNVTIMGPGTEGPDEGIDRTSVSFTVNVYQWGEENHGEQHFPLEDDSNG